MAHLKFITLFSILSSSAFAEPPFVPKWERFSDDTIKCLAFSKSDGTPMYKGAKVNESHCSSQKKPLIYKVERTQFQDLGCYAYSTIDNKVLNRGQTVDLINHCPKFSEMIEYKWGRSPSQEYKCYAYFKKDKKILYKGASVTETNCPSFDTIEHPNLNQAQDDSARELNRKSDLPGKGTKKPSQAKSKAVSQ